METASLVQLLSIVAWFPVAVLLALFMLIARFYQKQTGELTYFPLFGVPIVCFGLAAAQEARTNQIFSDPIGDVLLFAGGVILVVLCVLLYRKMTSGR
jgi:hypothetical protein